MAPKVVTNGPFPAPPVLQRSGQDSGTEVMTMRRWFCSLLVLAGLVALAACAAEEKATPAPAGPTGGAAPWQEEWDRVVAAAKREGRIAISGPAGDEPRRALEGFEKKFGIQVEYLGGRGPEFTERGRTESAAG